MRFSEARHGRALRFRALRAAASVSPSILNARLAEANAGIVAVTDEGHVLTVEGRALLQAPAPLAAWAERCARRRVNVESPNRARHV